MLMLRGLILLCLLMLPGMGADLGSTPDASATAPRAQPGGHPFVVFPVTNWYPTRPKCPPALEALEMVLFVAAPLVTALGLRVFFRRTRALGGPVGWGRLAAGNVLVLLFLLSSILLAAEFYYRFFVDTTDSIAFTRISERWVKRHWRTNGAGCRDNIEYAAAIQPGKRRLTFVGDSFTAGHGVKQVEDRFANRLRAAHPDWEVHVLARVGMDTGDEIKVLNKAFYRNYQLDEVVLVYCLNDVGDLLLAPDGPLHDAMPSVEQVPPWYLRASYFLDLLYNRNLAARNPYVRDYFSFVKAGYRAQYWEAQKQRLREFRDLVQSHGGRLSVVTFPFLHALGPNYDYGFVHQELADFWKDLQVPYLDLLPFFSGHASSDLTVNAHDAHPNELAHRLAADAINRQLWPVFTNRGATTPAAAAGRG